MKTRDGRATCWLAIERGPARDDCDPDRVLSSYAEFEEGSVTRQRVGECRADVSLCFPTRVLRRRSGCRRV